MRLRLLHLRITIMLVCMLLMANTMAITAYAFDNSVKEGTVAVVFYLKNAVLYATDGENLMPIQNIGDTEWGSGSGFFVGDSGDEPQYIVTNCHVIDGYLTASEGEGYLSATGMTYTYNGTDFPVVIYAESCELRVYYSQDDYDTAYVDCHGDVDKVDLAVLKLRNGTDKRHTLSLLVPTEDMIGETVYTVGYPGNADNDFTSASKYGIEDATVHKGSINRFVVNDGKGVERIAVDATIQHGNSGGPLVTENGYVVGVNTNVYSTSPFANQIEADYYAISTSELIRFLDKNNIPYEMASDGKGGGSIGGIIIGLVVVVVIAAVVFFVLKNKDNVQMLSKLANKKNIENRKNAVIRSMSPQHGGKAFPVGGSPTVIGRNAAKCAIVFQEGTAGVSGIHCSVSYDANNNVFTLTDLGSSFGTFLANGMKLTANSPINLKPGDIFFIGEKTNVFKLEVGE